MQFSRLFDRWFGRVQPKDETLWHKWRTRRIVRLKDGSFYQGAGQLWRRRTPDGWEFLAEEETAAEWADRQI